MKFLLLKRLEIFVYKRAAVCFTLLTAAALALGLNTAFMAGLPLGLLLSIWRFKANTVSFKKTFARTADLRPLKAALSCMTLYMLTELLSLLALFIALKLDSGLFAGLVAGILIIPLAVFISGITDVTGITHHHFQSQVLK